VTHINANQRNVIRTNDEVVSLPVKKSRKKFRSPFAHAHVEYNGGFEEYEDPADYVRGGSIKGTVIA
jgi:hypothetical protein